MVHGPWCSTFDGVSALLFDVLPSTIGASPLGQCHNEGSRYFYTTPDRGIAASLQDLTRLFTGKPACEAWSKGIDSGRVVSILPSYSRWYAPDNPTVPRPLV